MDGSQWQPSISSDVEFFTGLSIRFRSIYNSAVTQEKYTCSDQCWNNGVNSSGNQLKAVDIVMLSKITANECEDGHCIV